MSVPSNAQKLGEFIAAAKSNGTDDRFIAAMLRQNGWSERRVFAAFSLYYETVLGIPVPPRGGRCVLSRRMRVHVGDPLASLLRPIASR